MSQATDAESTVDASEDDVLKVLLATDIHLGYNEKDEIRGKDSFVAFEEILLNAKKHDVDFILLGGDLFHDPKPSQNALNKCLQLLRTYTLGDRNISIEILSEQSFNFHDTLNGTVNYEDPNMNVAYPVFSIHGNHDDPTGFGGVSSLDLLSTSGLVNYFGKSVNLSEIHLKPILLRKGQTQMALYGLSHIHDNRLARLFRDSKVVMERTPENSGEWFNMLVLHQNRADRGLKNYIPENILPNFLDLIMWGHEHDCRIWPEENPCNNFYVTQPGSSVATSLAEGEANDKHIGLLKVYKNKFKLEAIKLDTVRPFVFKSYNLANMVDDLDLDDVDAADKVREFARTEIEEMIKRAEEKLTGHPEQPTLPLIRLRLQYNDENQMFNHIRFGQQFNLRIANPLDCLHLQRSKRRSASDKKTLDIDAMNLAFQGAMDDVNVEDIVERYFNEASDGNKLEVLILKNMSELCRRLVQSDDGDAADRIIAFSKERACAYLNGKMPVEEHIEDELAEFRETAEQVHQDTLKMLDNRGNNSTPINATRSTVDMDTDDKENSESTSNNRTGTSKPTAAARGRATRGSVAPTTSRVKPAATPRKSELNITTSKAQPSIQQAMSKAAARPSRGSTRRVTYEDSD